MQRLSKLLVLGAAGILSVAAHAQDRPTQAPVPPPPGMNDSGVKPAPASTAPASAASSLRGLPDLPALGAGKHDSGRDGMDQPPPTVDVREVQGDKVEEYRINGRLYMIHVIPKHGIPQTYMANPEGELMRKPGQPPVKPVFYTIYKWGGSQSAKDNGDDGN